MAENGLYPVSLKRHRDLFWRRFTSYRFAQGLSTCPIVISEVSQIAASFPILFEANEQGYFPVALLSAAAEWTSPIVDQDGRWLAPYVPSALRCFPFQAGFEGDRNTAEAAKPVLCVDERSGLISSDTQGIPFFDDQDRLSPELLKVRLFLKHRENDSVATRQICSLIAELNLFQPLRKHDGITLPKGLWGIGEQLDYLPDVHTRVLLTSGAYRLIHAHQISLSHCAWLYRAQIERAGGRLKPEGPLNQFITAIAKDVSHSELVSEATYAAS